MSLALFNRLLDLSAGADESLYRWLASAKERALDGERWDEALGLTSREAKRERNRLLYSAGMLLARHLSEPTQSAIAAQLEDEIQRYQARIRPRLRSGGRAVDDLEPVMLAIHRAHECGCGMITCKRRLVDLFQPVSPIADDAPQ